MLNRTTLTEVLQLSARVELLQEAEDTNDEHVGLYLALLIASN
jgi:hypothetical protein